MSRSNIVPVPNFVMYGLSIVRDIRFSSLEIVAVSVSAGLCGSVADMSARHEVS